MSKQDKTLRQFLELTRQHARTP